LKVFVIGACGFVAATGWLICTKVHWVQTGPREEDRGSITLPRPC